jgi:hypothetical protein
LLRLQHSAPGQRTKTLGATGKDKEVEIVDYLLVQNARSVSIENGIMRLKDVTPDTLYFSDRPERIVGRVTTDEFIKQWSMGNDSFKEDPPNAVLSVLHKPEPLDIAVVLRNPRMESKDLVYDVEVLDGKAPAKGDECALFIDVVGRPLTPLSYAGMARRTSRRTARRVARRH